ncbi:MAG: serine/threonine-protein kinase, partial [Gemmatimonadaceae bacterium]
MSHDGQTRGHEAKKVLDHLQSQLGADIRLLEILGADGAELLVRARDVDRDRDVVLKILAVDRGLLPEAYQHFENEVAAAAQILHPNIAPVQPIERRGALVYYAMDLGSARTLESLLRTPRAPSLEPARRILGDVAAALDHAHERGVVHGALSPTAIFIGEDGAARVSGFALAGAPRVTARSGAPAYMAPEQWHGDVAVGERADQYALGVIAYELITGQRRTTSAGAGGVITVDPLPLAVDRPLAAGIPVAVTAAILRAMSKRPASRFNSCREFVAALLSRTITPVQSLPTQRPSVSDDGRSRVALLPVAAVVLFGIVIGTLAVPSVRQAFTASIFREEAPPAVALPSVPAGIPPGYSYGSACGPGGGGPQPSGSPSGA